MTPEDALADAHERFGDIQAIRAACLDAEDDHPLRLAGRVALRVGMLAVGFGAVALAFALVQSVLLQPLRFADADRLVRFGEGWDDAQVRASTFSEWRDQSTSFDGLTALNPAEYVLTGNGLPLRVRAMRIGSRYFDVFGVAPVLGRTFGPRDVEDTPQPVVLISETIWETHYRRSPTILGRSMLLNGVPHTVVGVIPEQGQLSHRVEIWTPLPLNGAGAEPMVYAVGRLRHGVSLEEARAEIAALTDGLAVPDQAASRTHFHPLHDLYATPVRPTILLMVVVGGLILLLVWAAVFRGAFGRSPIGRVSPVASSRQIWGEAVAVSGGAAVLGSVLAVGVHRLTYDALVEHWGELFAPPEVTVFGIVIALALATAVGLVGTQQVVSWHAMRRWAEHGLLTVATAATVVLLVIVGQQHQTVWSAAAPDPGLDDRGLYVASVAAPGGTENMGQRMSRVLNQVRAVPGVEAASLGWGFPFLSEERLILQPVRLDPEEVGRQLAAAVDLVETGYSEALRAPLIEGRAARAMAPEVSVREVVVSETFATQAWPGQSALGRRIDVGVDGLVRTVVGVMGDVRYATVDPDVPILYIPYAEYAMPQAVLIVRGGESLSPAVRRAVFDADPEVAVQPLMAVASLRARAGSAPQTRLLLLSVLVLLALACVLAGVVQVERDRARARIRWGETPAGFAWANGLVAVGVGLASGVGLVFVATRELAWFGDVDALTIGAAAVATGLLLVLTNWLAMRRAVPSV